MYWKQKKILFIIRLTRHRSSINSLYYFVTKSYVCKKIPLKNKQKKSFLNE